MVGNGLPTSGEGICFGSCRRPSARAPSNSASAGRRMSRQAFMGPDVRPGASPGNGLPAARFINGWPHYEAPPASRRDRCATPHWAHEHDARRSGRRKPVGIHQGRRNPPRWRHGCLRNPHLPRRQGPRHRPCLRCRYANRIRHHGSADRLGLAQGAVNQDRGPVDRRLHPEGRALRLSPCGRRNAGEIQLPETGAGPDRARGDLRF